MRPHPLTLVCIPVGRHTVVGLDCAGEGQADRLGVGVGGCNVAHFTADNCT